MITHLFITPDGDERGKWIDAFPDASVVAGGEVAANGDAELIWLDYDGLTGDAKFEWFSSYLDPAKKIVVMSNAPSEEEAYLMIQAGAYGYCHALAATSQLQEIATVIGHGGIWVGQQVLQRIVRAGINRANPQAQPPAEALLNKLTKREKMVATHVAQGASNREIAEALNITERTVKAHVSVMFEKLAVRDRVQLALKLNNVEI